MKKIIIPVIVLFTLCMTACSTSTTDTKSEVPCDAVYKNASAPVEDRVADLLSRMTLEEKIGQMTQIERGNIQDGDIEKYYLGSILSGGGSTPSTNTAAGWQAMITGFEKAAMSTRLAIPIIYGNDSVHGQNNLKNATIFPHNIGLGAANDSDLVKRIGVASAQETAATGVQWAFAPCVAAVHDVRWGRTYESFGTDTALVTKLGTAFIEGFQSFDDSGTSYKMMATAKHFLGDGGTKYDETKTPPLNEGDMVCDEAYWRTNYLPPYKAAVDAGVRIIMPSFSSWNGEKMHGSTYMLTTVLKGELQFTGFVISDWAGMNYLDSDYYTAMVKGINAGVDMNMVPDDADKFITAVKKAVNSGDITQSRIDDAVSRILRVKFEMGLFEHPYPDSALTSVVYNDEHKALAREAVTKSVTILKNANNVLPLKSTTEVYLCGSGSNNIGRQCGGWTIAWQGGTNINTAGTTIKKALENNNCTVHYNMYGTFTDYDKSKICLVVIAEDPYAETAGDSKTLAIKDVDKTAFDNARDKFDTVVLVVISGRPVILGDLSTKADAIAAAWLPGSEGGNGIYDVLFGAVSPTAKLSVAWPVSVDQLPADNFISGTQTPLYPVGYGLTW